MHSDVQLFIVRHGQTEWNTEQRIQGHLDTALSEVGRRQARTLAQRLQTIRFDACYSSDLQRAHQTALAVTAHQDCDVALDVRLRERAYGAFEGLRLVDVEEQLPEMYQRHRSCDPHFDYQGGQSRQQKHDEVVSFLSDIAHRHHGQRILACSHGGSMSLLMNYVLGIALDQEAPFYFKNTGICCLEYEAQRWIFRSIEA